MYLTNSTGGMPGLNNGKVVKLPYTDVQAFSGGLGGTHHLQVYRMSSIFDPDFTNAGAQPLAHDEYATFYEKYQVIGAKCTTTFRWADPSASTDGPALVFAWPDADSTAPSTLTTKMERYPGKWRILNPPGTGGDQTTKIINYYSAKKFFNFKDIQDEHQIKAPFTADPLLDAFLVTGCQDMEGGDTTDRILTVTTISYLVRLLEPKPILGS